MSKGTRRKATLEALDSLFVALWALSTSEIETFEVVRIAFAYAHGRDLGPGAR